MIDHRPVRLLRALLLGLCLAQSTASLANEQARGISVILREGGSSSPANSVDLYQASYALVIGIDAYSQGWPRLHNAVKDAEVVAEELRSRGFIVSLRTDLKSLELQKTLKEFFAIQGSDPEARLLLWFAGHGHTINDEGFLVPADAPRGDDPLFKVSALHMRDFGGLMRLVDSKHVLSVFDACFAGTIFGARAGAPPALITRKTTRPVRQFVTSGDAGQQVRDDGSFRELFLRAIRGEDGSDPNRDGYVTGEELGLYLSQELSAFTNAAQTPRYGKLQDVRYDRGDFVFVVPGHPRETTGEGTPGKALDPAQSERAAEIVFWESIRESATRADFEAYLEQFPQGTFASLARVRLDNLPRQQAALPPPAFEIDALNGLYVALKNSNLRTGPSIASKRIGLLPALSTVVVTGRLRDRSWYRVSYRDAEAFVHAPLLEALSAEELAAWESTKDSGNRAELTAFLETYPKSAFASRIRAKLTKPSGLTERALSHAELEGRLWRAVKDSANRADLEYYLARFPDGTHAARARTQIASLGPAGGAKPESAPTASKGETSLSGAAAQGDFNGRWVGKLRIKDVTNAPPRARLGYIDGECGIRIRVGNRRFREYLSCFNRSWILSGTLNRDGSLHATSLYETHAGLYERIYVLSGPLWQSSGVADVSKVGKIGEARLSLARE